MSKSLISSKAMQRSVALLAIICLVVIFSSSLWSRIQNPGITLETTTRAPAGQDQEMLAQVSSLMAEVERNPGNIQALTELAHVFMLMQAWERAYSFWSRVLEIEPENKLALNQGGFTLFQQERYQEAAQYFQALLTLDETSYRSLFNLGIIYKYYLNDQDRAQGYFQRILDLEPQDPQLIERVMHELDTPEGEPEDIP